MPSTHENQRKVIKLHQEHVQTDLQHLTNWQQAIREIFEESQQILRKSARMANFYRLCTRFQTIIDETGEDQFEAIVLFFWENLKCALVVAQPSEHVNAFFSFLAYISHRLKFKGEIRPTHNKRTTPTLVRFLFVKSYKEMQNIDTTIRYRALQLARYMAEEVTVIPPEMQDDEEEKDVAVGLVMLLSYRHIEAMRANVRICFCDRQSKCRVEAIKLSKHLQSTEEDDDIVSIIKRAMVFDPAPEIRQAAVDALIVSKNNLDSLLDRTRDVNDSVRLFTYKKLIDRVSARAINIEQRNHLLFSGLNDPSKQVRTLVATKMLPLWMSDLAKKQAWKKYKPPAEVQNETEEIEMTETVKMLILIDKMNPLNLGSQKTIELAVKSCVHFAISQCSIEDYVNKLELLTPLRTLRKEYQVPEGALLNKILCEYMYERLAGHEDARLYTVLDKLLPNVTNMCKFIEDYINEHVLLDENDMKGQSDSLVTSTYVAHQLLKLLPICVHHHYEDAHGREIYCKLVQQILINPNCPYDFMDLLVDLLVQANYDNADSGKHSSIKTVDDIVTESTIVYMAEEVIWTRIQCDGDESSNAANTSIEAFMSENDVEDKSADDLAREYRRKEHDREMDRRRKIILNTDKHQLVPALQLTCALLRQPIVHSMTPQLQELFDHLVLHSHNHISSAVREHAFRAIALYGLIDKEIGEQAVAILAGALIAEHLYPQTQAVIIQGLRDLYCRISNFDIIYNEFKKKLDKSKLKIKANKERPLKSAFVQDLLDILGNENLSADVIASATTALCALMYSSRICSPKVFNHLVMLWFIDENGEEANKNDRQQQCLATFLLDYSSASLFNRRVIAESMPLLLDNLFNIDSLRREKGAKLEIQQKAAQFVVDLARPREPSKDKKNKVDGDGTNDREPSDVDVNGVDNEEMQEIPIEEYAPHLRIALHISEQLARERWTRDSDKLSTEKIRIYIKLLEQCSLPDINNDCKMKLVVKTRLSEIIKNCRLAQCFIQHLTVKKSMIKFVQNLREKFDNADQTNENSDVSVENGSDHDMLSVEQNENEKMTERDAIDDLLDDSTPMMTSTSIKSEVNTNIKEDKTKHTIVRRQQSSKVLGEINSIQRKSARISRKALKTEIKNEQDGSSDIEIIG